MDTNALRKMTTKYRHADENGGPAIDISRVDDGSNNFVLMCFGGQPKAPGNGKDPVMVAVMPDLAKKIAAAILEACEE